VFTEVSVVARGVVPRPPQKEWATALVREALRNRPAEMTSVAALAASCGLDPRRLGWRFRHETGVTLRKVVAECRLDEAARLIEQGEKIDAVVLHLGYRSRSSFGRRFQRRYGCSPGRVRDRPRRDHFDDGACDAGEFPGRRVSISEHTKVELRTHGSDTWIVLTGALLERSVVVSGDSRGKCRTGNGWLRSPLMAPVDTPRARRLTSGLGRLRFGVTQCHDRLPAHPNCDGASV
jgi:AraC-like DNA-binding protein